MANEDNVLRPVIMGDKPLEYPKDAYHDPETGMYTMGEPLVNEAEFEKLTLEGKDIFLPRPHYKPIRSVQFSEPFAYLEVLESLDRVKALIDMAKDELDEHRWFVFTDPVFATPIHVQKDTLRHACWVQESWKDMEQVKLKLQEADHAKNMIKLGMMQQRGRG